MRVWRNCVVLWAYVSRVSKQNPGCPFRQRAPRSFRGRPRAPSRWSRGFGSELVDPGGRIKSRLSGCGNLSYSWAIIICRFLLCKGHQRRRAIQRIALRKKVLWGLQRKFEQTNKTDPTALTLVPYADKDFAPLATRASPQTPGRPQIDFIRNEWRYSTSDKSKGVNMQSYKQANRQNDGFHVCMFTQFKGYSFL